MELQMLEWAAKGGLLGVCLLVIYLGWKREERSAAAFEKLNDRSAAVSEKTIEQLTKLNANTQALHDEIRQRPCMARWDGDERRKEI